MSALHRCY